MRRSQSWLRKGDNIAALRDADEAVSFDPDDAANYANRAAVMRALNRQDDAVADLRKGPALRPKAALRQEIETALRELGAALSRPAQAQIANPNMQLSAGGAPGDNARTRYE